MKLIRLLGFCCFYCAVVLLAGCSGKPRAESSGSATKSEAAPSFFKVDPATAGTVTGIIRFTGKAPTPKLIDMRDDPACVTADHEKAYDESLVVDQKGGLANAFVYIKSGLEGKTFAIPAAPVILDQRGCMYRPHVLGIQTGQALRVVNSDPLTHHVQAQTNPKWGLNQPPRSSPVERRFIRSEVMIPVLCNIHSWMSAYIGVVNHPYFAVSKDDGSFEIDNLPPGKYTIAAWQEKLGTQEQQITVQPSGKAEANFTFK